MKSLLTSKQLSVAKSLAMEQSETVSLCPESSALAAFRTIILEATSLVAICASWNWLCWKSARGRPNCRRTSKWSRAASREA